MPAYRTQANTGTDVLVSSHTITTPGTVVSGDYGVFWLTRWDGTSFPTVTAPAGAVLRGTIATGNLQTQCYLIKTAGEASFTFSWTGARWSNLSVQFFSGVDPSLTLSTAPFSSATGTGTSITTVSVTTVNTASLSFCVNTLDYPSTTTHGPPTGFTETADFDSFTNDYFIATSSGSVSAASATLSVSQAWAAGLVSLEPASGGSTAVSGADTSAGTDTESLAVSTSDSDTSGGVESQSLAVTNSDSDVGAGSEGTPTIGVSDTETSTGVDSEATTQGANDGDSPSGSDTESVAAALSDSDTSSGTDSESVAATTSDSDTGSGTDTESASQSTPSDTNTGTDTESIAVSTSDTDTSSGADTEAISAAISSSDTGSGLDTETVDQGGLSLNDADTPSGADTESIAASTSATETNAGTDTESVTASTSDAETSSGSETFGLAVQVSDSDTSNATDSATATISSTTTPSDSDTPSVSESWSIVIFGASVPERSLVLGPATLYIAPFGAVEPSNGAVATAPDSGVWTDLGGTLGGVELSVEQDWITVDLKQLPDQPMRRVKKRRLMIKTSMAEPTLLNLGYVLNDTTSGSAGVNWSAYAPAVRTEASQLSYMALIVDGWKPGYLPGGQHKRRRVIVRKCLSIDNIEFGYSKNGQTVYTVTWSCHYVDATTPPFRVVDAA